MSPTNYLQAFASLIFVVALIGLVGWAYRRYGGRMLGGAPLGSRRRLEMVESLTLDARHRLVLVSRDGHEHLLLLGGDGASVVEQNIDTPVPATRSSETVTGDAR